MNRSAFTMLELVFVIVIIAILGVLALPSFDKNELELAAEQVASDIRYTQHLAMKSDKFDPSDSEWYKKRWQFRFRLLMGENGYVVFADDDKNRNSDDSEIAIEPSTGAPMNGFKDSFPAGNLTKRYKINSVDVSCKTNDGTLVTANRGVIAFDNLGRPYNGVTNATSSLQYLLKDDCNITLTSPKGSIMLRVYPETGYVCTINPTTNACVETN